MFALIAAAGADVSLPLTALAVLPAYLPSGMRSGGPKAGICRPLVAAIVARDVMLPAVWARGWLGGAVNWRGNAMTIDQGRRTGRDTVAGLIQRLSLIS